MDRTTAARIGGMDHQTLWDRAHRFNYEPEDSSEKVRAMSADR
jgi:hypothetical protein